ncbi:LAQU0S12e02322g1_1 [Lachancea quebecensis]|uniref:Protein STU1 n=1 Tax=Lachancea quebecensis TaxID=1654605 RepID=A0A0P1KV20_9SACH|nr:LAQU0S12e02322g1_1 [Lachancea quebecensis]
MANVRTFPLYDVLMAASASDEQKLQQLSEFKGHVKKELVDEQAIPAYFECLCHTLNIHLESGRTASRVFTLCHSTLCYLIKRVAMQSPVQFDAETTHRLLIPLLQTVNLEKKIWSGSMKALEAIYLAQPSVLEEALEKLQLRESDRVATLLVIDELVQLHQRNNRNPLEILNKFTTLFLSILNQPKRSPSQDCELIRDILAKYYTMQSMQDFARRIRIPESKALFDVKPELPIEEVYIDSDSKSQQSIFSVDTELHQLFKDQAKNSPTQSKNYSSPDILRRDLENLVAPFASHKETEHNWRKRQEAIITLRAAIAGNAVEDYSEDLITLFKELQLSDCISKAVSSLRTSLSIHGCYLVKEMASRLQEKIDPLAESLFNSLRNVLSATKKLASQNAFFAACSLLAAMQFHNRIFQSCFMLSKDKNVSPRCFGAVFLRIFLIRFHSKLDNGLVYIDEWVHRSITDAQTKVRESMRTTFWYYYKAYPTNAKRLLDGLLPHFRRAVEASIPPNLDINYSINNAKSSDSSRRSSLGPSRTPSYAGPTQSSHLQRLSALRSASDYQPPPNRVNQTNPNARKTSGPAGLMSKPENAVSQPSQGSLNDLSAQIDLTAEITQNNSNTLIKKYMQHSHNVQDKHKYAQTELKDVMHYLSSQNPSENKMGLQLLQNVILVGVPLLKQEVNPLLRKIMIRDPQCLESLLRIPKFLDLLTVSQSIEAFAINRLPCTGLTERLTAEVLTEGVNALLADVFPSEKEYSFYYVKFRQTLFDYSFDILTNVCECTERLSNASFSAAVSKLFGLYGNDLNLPKYFDTLFHLFSHNRVIFLDLLGKTPVFLKTKIGHELEKRDPNLHLDFLVQRDSIADVPSEDEKLYTELTMVQPSAGNQRSSSAESVLIHEFQGQNSQKVVDKEAELATESPEEVQGFTKFGGLSKLTEMTRVVSLYEKHKDPVEAAKNSALDTDGDHRMSSEGIENKSETPDVDLSDIFGEERGKKTNSVKFHDNPSIIQQTDISFSGVKKLDGLDNFEAISSNNSDLDTVCTIEAKSDHESTQSDPAGQDFEETAWDMHKATRNCPKKDIVANSDATNNLKEEEIPTYKMDFLVLTSEWPLLRFELEAIVADLGIPYHPESMASIINKIKSGSFTVKDLNLMIGFILVSVQQDTLQNWFTQANAFTELLKVQEILLESIENSLEFPEALAVRCLLLCSCLVIMELGNQKKLSDQNQGAADMAWAYILNIVDRAEAFTSESFLLCEDLRSILLSRQRMECTKVKKLVARLGMVEATSTVKKSFLIASSHMILKTHADLFDIALFEEISKRAMLCMFDDITELRKESLELLGTLWDLTSRQEQHVQAFDQLPQELMKLIISL